MAADLIELKRMIEGALPGSSAEVFDETGTGDHLRAEVRAPQFDGQTRINQHRMVKAAVRERFDDGTIHALTIKVLE
ncbi:MAG: BolA/IbaG family iron-sulfur metabolism protein [Solirubrobacterales bacterium]|nr:BolA/IbaG family iron-sulfur metabolism protein [Solirubrobacterales bacterium]